MGFCFFSFRDDVGMFIVLGWELWFFYVVKFCVNLLWVLFLKEFIRYELLGEVFSVLYLECCESLFMLLENKFDSFFCIDFDEWWWCVCGFWRFVLMLIVGDEGLLFIEYWVF